MLEPCLPLFAHEVYGVMIVTIQCSSSPGTWTPYTQASWISLIWCRQEDTSVVDTFSPFQLIKIVFNSLLSTHCFQMIAFNSFLSTHFFQLISFNSLLSNHCFQLIAFNSLISTHYFQLIDLNSLLSTHCFHFIAFNSILSTHWYSFKWKCSLSKTSQSYIKSVRWPCVVRLTNCLWVCYPSKVIVLS